MATAMADYQQQQQSGRINHDYPPFSRIFIVCSKNHKEEEMRQAFAPCGSIEDVWMVKDRMTKESKGICYIKFDKASSAAQAIESMDGKLVANDPKPIKVISFHMYVDSEYKWDTSVGKKHVREKVIRRSLSCSYYSRSLVIRTPVANSD